MNSEWSINRYTPGDRELWNSLVTDSRQGTMLHKREYMDYHSDRFTDCSLIALRRDKPVAILPANITDDGTLHSHQGLTYGGWLTPLT
ncbi:MAG: GNAT family N-acetyltransferase, partial [Paramuribaculum sp.]|nr:GNAT family N-acetyltransferase [Paramuribaculum sp.]